MIRDFSESAKDDLISLVSEVEDEKWCDFTDWIGDGWYDFAEWIGILSLKDDLSNVNSYHKKVIDKNNTTLSDIEKIFDDVYDVESNYHESIQHISDTCRAFNRLLVSLTDAIAPGKADFTVENVNSLLNESFNAYVNLFDTYVDWENRLNMLLEEYKLKSEITNEDKDAYIDLYEEYNVKLKKELEKLLEKLSDEQIRDVKFIIYSAEEPYRSIYMLQLENYTIGNVSGDDTGYFTSGNNTINVDMEAELTNPRGSYTTFFHESGHAIDYNFKNDKEFYSITYRDNSGQSLQDVIYEDVENDIKNTIEKYTSDEDIQDKILEYIMGAGSVDISSLSKAEKSVLKVIQDQYSNEFAGAVNEAPSDVYGGVTNNIIIGSYGHRGDNYWYKSNGEATYSQSKELWAEYYSYCVTGNEQALSTFREHFPKASVFLDEMAASMKK